MHFELVYSPNSNNGVQGEWSL